MSPPYLEGLEVIELLGSGGSGSVYRAYDREHDRDVAVKVVAITDEASRARFDGERVSLGRLSAHPGIVDVYDSGFTREGDAYIVMPVIEGGTLRDRLDREQRVPWAEATEAMEAVSRAIAAGHAEGVVHGDLKPSNILLDSSGAPLVVDFGVSNIAMTGQDDHAYTAAFAAPELFAGEPHTTASDVFGLGASLYTLISGHSVHGDTTAPAVAIAHRALRGAPARLDPTLAPPDVSDVVSSCLVAPAAERPQAADVARWLDQVEVLGATVTRVGVSPVQQRPGRWKVAVGAAIGLGLLGLGALVAVQSRSPRGSEPAEAVQPAAAPAAAVAPPTTQADALPSTTGTTTSAAPPVAVAVVEPLAPWSEPVSYVTQDWATTVVPQPGPVFAPTVDEGTLWVATGPDGDGNGSGWRQLDLATYEVLNEASHPRIAPSTPGVVNDGGVWFVGCCASEEGRDMWTFGFVDKADMAMKFITAEPVVNGAFQEPLFIGRQDFVGDGVGFPYPAGMVYTEATPNLSSGVVEFHQSREFTGSPAVYSSNQRVSLTPVSATGLGVLRLKDVGAYFSPDLDVIPLEAAEIGTVTPFVHVAPDRSAWLVTLERIVVRGEFGGTGVTDIIVAGPCPVDEPSNFDICVAPETGEAVLGHGALWVPNIGDDSIYRIDLESRLVSHVIPVGSDPGTPVLGKDAVWVANTGDATVSRIDATSNRVTATIPLLCGDDPCQPWPEGLSRNHRPVVVGDRVLVPWAGALAVIDELPAGMS